MSNVTSVTQHFSTSNEGFVTTTSGIVLSGATTVGLSSTSGLTNGSIFVGVIEPGATKQQVFTGVVNTGSSSVTGVKWTRGTNADHAAGVTIVDYVTGTDHNMMTKGILVEHDQDGTHKDVTADSLVVAGTTTLTGSVAINGTPSGAGFDLKNIKNSYKFNVYRQNTLSAINGTDVVFDTVNYDTGSNYSTSTGLFTVPVTGYYHFSAQITLGNYNSGYYWISLKKNGSELYRGNRGQTSANGNYAPQISIDDFFTAGDTVSIAPALQASSTFEVTSNNTRFIGHLISKT